MFKKMLCKAVSVIRRMNQWWDKDEDKGVAAIISGIIILIGILILNKAVLFIIALILIINRVIHRFNLWTNCECSTSESEASSKVEFNNSEFNDPESVTDGKEKSDN